MRTNSRSLARRSAAALLAFALIPWFPAAARAVASWPMDSTLGLPVCRTPGLQQHPIAVSDSAHGFIVLWSDYRNGISDADLYARRVDTQGDTLWGGNGSPVCARSGNQQLPTAVADGRGGILAAWVDLGAFGIYAQRLDRNGAPRWGTFGRQVSGSFTSTNGPVLCADGAGGAFLTWAPGTGILLGQHLDSLGSRWTFFPPAVHGVTLRATGNPIPRAIVSDGSNGAIVALGAVSGSNSTVTVQHYNLAQSVLWGANGVDLTVQPAAVIRSMVPDGTGGVFVSWDDTRNGGGNADVFVQRVSAAGVPMWTANGVAVSGAPLNQFLAVLRPLADGGVVVVWRDHRTNVSGDLYAQRLDAAGAPQWTLGGVPVATGISQAEVFSLAAGRGDSTFVVWNSSALNGGDVFAQAIDGNGNRLFGPAGIGICRAPAVQSQSFAIGDDLGGVYALYVDPRAGDDDIQAQHVDADGLTGPGVLAVPDPSPAPGGTAPLHAWPNPCRGALHIALSRARESEGRAQVLDVAGRVRWSAPVSRFGMGIEWDGRDARGVPVEPGVYRVRVTRGTEVGEARVVFVR